MKRTLLLVLVGMLGCGGEPFEQPMIWKAHLEAGLGEGQAGSAGQAPDADPPDGGQDAPGETDPPDGSLDVQGSDPSPEASPDAEPDAGPDSEPDSAPETCAPAACPSGAICGRIDDGCGGVKMCGADYQRSDSDMDLACTWSAGQPYAWKCGWYGVGIPTSEPAPDAPGPAPMAGCIWSGKWNVIPPDLNTYAWCCPSETLPAH